MKAVNVEAVQALLTRVRSIQNQRTFVVRQQVLAGTDVAEIVVRREPVET